MSSRRRLGLRREISILVPVSLLLVVLLSTFTLFAHRNALRLLTEERRAEAQRASRSATAELSAGLRISEDDLRRVTRGAIASTVVAADGTPLLSAGEPLSGEPLSLLAGQTMSGDRSFGPGRATGDRVVAFASLRQGKILRVDYPARMLANQLRLMRALFGIVLAADIGVLILVLLFVRRLLTPYERMLDRARQLERDGTLAMAPVSPGEVQDPDDEMAFLISTFDRALWQLSQREPRSEPEVRSEPEARPRPEARFRQEAGQFSPASEVAGSTSPEPRAGVVADSEELRVIGQTLAPSFDSGLLLLDRRGEVLALNDVGARLLSVGPPPPGTPVEELLERHGELLVLLTEAIEAGQGVKRRECQVGDLALGLTVHALRPVGPEVRGFLVLFADLTQARRDAHESRLAESLAQLGELAAGVAHELRNSLGTLRGYIGLMERRRRQHPSASDTGDYLAEMRRETEHLQRVLEDFLTFARPGTFRPQPVDLGLLVRGCASDPALSGAQVEIVEIAEPATSGRSGPMMMQADPQLLERAVRNLLRNAVEAERRAGLPGGARVELRRSEDSLEIRVEDRGPGVSEEMLDRLFLPFATGRADGVGLGLALTHRIVTLHGGTIRHQHRKEGGARFSLAFPVGMIDTKRSDASLDQLPYR